MLLEQEIWHTTLASVYRMNPSTRRKSGVVIAAVAIDGVTGANVTEFSERAAFAGVSRLAPTPPSLDAILWIESCS